MSTAPFYIAPSDPPSKQEILKAALRLFARDGLVETSIRAIAEEAGYTNPAIFKFFDSKEALALHLFERCYLRLFAEVDVAIRSDRPFKANLHAVVQAHIEYFETHPDAFLFIQDRLREFWPKMPPRVRSESIIAKLSALLDQGIREGAVNGEVNKSLLIAAMTGFFVQFARMAYFGEFKGKTADWAPDIEAMIHKMLAV